LQQKLRVSLETRQCLLYNTKRNDGITRKPVFLLRTALRAILE
jgi:hypothetical protein